MNSTQNKSPGGETPGIKGITEKGEIELRDSHKNHLHISGRLDEVSSLPHRNPLIHWTAFIFSLIALVPPVFWLVSPNPNLPPLWIWIDVGLGVFFVLEFLTRSGLRWNKASYIRSRFFDFVAVVPVLVLVYYQIPHLLIWVWIILIARFSRAVDRVLGDGFLMRNVLGLLEGIEEEISDRVMQRIITRARVDLERISFGKGVAESLDRNKQNLLQKVREQHPHQGLSGGLAQISGLNSALEKAEEHTFDAVIEIIRSPEVDHAIREGIDSVFDTLQKEVEVKSWRRNLGIKPGAPSRQGPDVSGYIEK